MTVLLSPVCNVVANIATSETTPAAPATSTKSPTLIGRNTMIITPAAKLDNVPCNAKPTAKPAAPKIATTDAV